MLQIVTAGEAEPLIELAAAELRRYLSLVGGDSNGAPVFGLESGVEGLHPQGYAVSTRNGKVTIAGSEPIGILYGVYGYLEELGFGFYLGGDVVPRREEFEFSPVNVRAEPAFDIRGSLIWPNFLNSPATWDLPDYQVFFDQMVKMKNNVVHIPAYGTPLEAYPPDGTATYYLDSARRIHHAEKTDWRGGDPFATSVNYGWGTPTRRWGRVSGFKCSEFGFGTGDWFDSEVFGSTATVEGKTREEQIVGAQEVFAAAVAYAGKRGLKIVLGTEVEGDPFDPEAEAALNRRLAHILKMYPGLDYLAIWQPESRSWTGPGPGEVEAWLQSAAFKEEYNRTSRHFQYLGRADLIAEAVRLSAFVNKAHAIVSRLRPGMRLLVCGWGGDHWMQSTELYPGLDKTLPKDVIFSSLDNIDPTADTCVSRVYGELSDGRERWPVPWFESDAGGSRRDQWGPQPNTRIFADLCRDAHKQGCEGFLGIHWRTRDLEEVFAYCARYAWQPEITYEAFYDDYAGRAYSSRHADEISLLLRELEGMGPRWTGSWGQWECRPFEWIGSGNAFSNLHDSRPNHVNISRLRQIRGRLSEMLSESDGGLVPEGRDRLRWLALTIDWLTQYDEVAVLLEPRGAFDIRSSAMFVQDAHGGKNHSFDEEIWELLRRAPLGDAMLAYASKISSRGELGVLATVNVKAYSTFLDTSRRIGLHRGNWPSEQVRAKGAKDSASVEWEPSISATAYRVWRRQAGRDGWDCLTPDPTRDLRFIDKGLSPGVYEYAITSVAPPRLESLRSFGATVRIGPEAEPPRIQVLEPPTVLWADDKLTLRAIVTSGRDVSSVLLHRQVLGGGDLPEVDFQKGSGATYKLELPLGEISGRVMLFAIEARDNLQQKSFWPTDYPARWQSLNVLA